MKLAEYQDLYYVKKVDFGVYLAEDMGGETHVLLPSKQVPEDAKPGEKIRVFLYKDSKTTVEEENGVIRVFVYIETIEDVAVRE